MNRGSTIKGIMENKTEITQENQIKRNIFKNLPVNLV
jgi:hypothetical protein